MEISQPFIRLPFSFDADRLLLETEAMPETAWRPHPTGLPGNAGLPLISRGGGSNDDFFGEMRPTEHLLSAPYFRQVLASFDEIIGRARLMRLEPGCEVSTHVDFNYHWHSRVRIHIPIVTGSPVLFSCADRTIHMAAGECWIFNSWRRHRVVNGWNRPRVHLVIDTAGSSRFWDMVDRAGKLDPEAEPAGFHQLVRFVPFEPDRSADVLTEQFNMLPVMAPGELDLLISEIISEFEQHPQNSRELIEQYRKVLMDLSRDWRVTWSRFGFREAGRPHYRQLLERVQQQLHPNRRALVTASNQVGVNPIIVQRILRAALAPEVSAQFESEPSSNP